MILDLIENASCYADIHTGVTKALKEMAKYTPDYYPGGRVDIDGDNLFLLLNSYETHSPEGALCEAHQKYIDVMYMVEGEEIIFVKPTNQLCAVTKAFNPEIDALLAQTDADATPVRLSSGSFIVLFPQDAHSPACYDNIPQTVKKIIGKVKI